MARNATVSFKVDARSIRSMKRNVDMAISGVAECTKESIRDFCEEVLYDAVQLVPIDTGALAESADFIIKGNKKSGYEARVGFGVGKRNPVNKRTGKPASSYAGTVHESVGTVFQTGQAKFFEQAVYQHESELRTKTGKSIKEYLSTSVVHPKEEVSDKSDSAEAARSSAIQARKYLSFTEQVSGKYLPFPVPKGVVYKKGSRWYLNKQGYRHMEDRRAKKVRKYKSTSKTAQSIRDKVLSRYTKQTTQERASTPVKPRRVQSATKSIPKKTSQVSSAAKKTPSKSSRIKAARSSASNRGVQSEYLTSSLRHETALEEFMQYLIDDGQAEKRTKKKKKGRYNGPIA